MTTRTEQAQHALDGYDLTDAEKIDIAFTLIEQTNQGAETVRRIRNVMLRSFECGGMLHIPEVDSIPPDGDDDGEN